MYLYDSNAPIRDTARKVADDYIEYMGLRGRGYTMTDLHNFVVRFMSGEFSYNKMNAVEAIALPLIFPTTEEATYQIRNTIDRDGETEHLYWSNYIGWTDSQSGTVFKAEERFGGVRLPMAGDRHEFIHWVFSRRK